VNKKQSVINKIFQIAAVVPFIFFMGITAVQASDQENECFNDIQGKIAWNDNKDLNWDAENVKQLCQGTSKPSEPGKCFQKLKSGQVSWGKSSTWEWKNIVKLCSGTNDAEKTVACFTKGMSVDGTDWRDAILTCQRTTGSHSKDNQLDWNK